MGKMLPYILILFSDLLFASQFLISRIYSRRNTRGLVASLAFSIGTNLSVLVYVFFLIGCRVEFSLFTVLIAMLYACISVLSSYCANAALSTVNLSLFSLFNMLGTVVLSALFGFLIFSEEIKLGTAICIALVVLALALGAEYRGGQKGAAKYYLACFFLNGITGTVTKLHQKPYAFVCGITRTVNTVFGTELSADPASFVGLGAPTDADAAFVFNNNYLWLCSFFTVVLAVIMLGAIALRSKRNTFAIFADGKNLACMGGYGVVHGVAQMISLFTLSLLPLSLQQPLVTGGVIAFAFIISLLIGEKKKPKDIAAFAVACLSMAAILLNYI